MSATASDYTWFSDRFPGLAEAYCRTPSGSVEWETPVHGRR
ncbi:hypothetical protein [Micromonospora sp. URMC 103]